MLWGFQGDDPGSYMNRACGVCVLTSLSPLPPSAVGTTEQPASVLMCRSVQLSARKELQPPTLCCGLGHVTSRLKPRVTGAGAWVAERRKVRTQP